MPASGCAYLARCLALRGPGTLLAAVCEAVIDVSATRLPVQTEPVSTAALQLCTISGFTPCTASRL